MRIISASSLFTFQERLDQIDTITDSKIDEILSSLRDEKRQARILFFGNINQNHSEYFDKQARIYDDSEIFEYTLSPNFKPAYGYTYKMQNSIASVTDFGIASYYYCGERSVRNYALAEALVYLWEQMSKL